MRRAIALGITALLGAAHFLLAGPVEAASVCTATGALRAGQTITILVSVGDSLLDGKRVQLDAYGGEATVSNGAASISFVAPVQVAAVLDVRILDVPYSRVVCSTRLAVADVDGVVPITAPSTTLPPPMPEVGAMTPTTTSAVLPTTTLPAVTTSLVIAPQTTLAPTPTTEAPPPPPPPPPATTTTLAPVGGQQALAGTNSIEEPTTAPARLAPAVSYVLTTSTTRPAPKRTTTTVKRRTTTTVRRTTTTRRKAKPRR